MNLEIAFENLQHAANTHGNIVLIVSIVIPILLHCLLSQQGS